MLKLVAIGIWVIVVTAGATFASVYLGKPSTASSAPDDMGVEEMTSELTSIPVLRGGDVAGYVILQLSFAADRALLGQKKLEPMPYIKDAAFRVIFTTTDVDFRRLKTGDLDRLTDMISKEANRKLGFELVRHVLFQQLNFVKKEDIRTNWINTEGASN
jgi:flagellar basal body-associated protein FliL